MTILVEPLNLLFTGVPGAASTSIEAALENLPGARWLAPKHTTVDTLIQEGVISQEIKEKLQIFCIIRNPFDMVHAEWHRSRKRWVLELDLPNSAGGWSAEKRRQIMLSAALDFSEFIKTYFGHAFNHNKKMNIYKDYTAHATKVFKLEQLCDIEIWIKNEFSTEINLPSINKTDGRVDYWRDYDSLARQIVTELFENEITEYGYRF